MWFLRLPLIVTSFSSTPFLLKIDTAHDYLCLSILLHSFNHFILLFLPLEKEKEYLKGYTYSIPLFRINRRAAKDGYLSTWPYINNLIDYLLFFLFTPRLWFTGQYTTSYCLVLVYMSLLFLGSIFFWQSLPVREGTPGTIIESVIDVGILSVYTAVIAYIAVSSYLTEQSAVNRLDKELAAANRKLESRNKELEKALQEVKTLSGILPICSYCRKIRNDRGYWNELETYLSQHTDAKMGHAICLDCLSKEMLEMRIWYGNKGNNYGALRKQKKYYGIWLRWDVRL